LERAEINESTWPLGGGGNPGVAILLLLRLSLYT